MLKLGKLKKQLKPKNAFKAFFGIQALKIMLLLFSIKNKVKVIKIQK